MTNDVNWREGKKGKPRFRWHRWKSSLSRSIRRKKFRTRSSRKIPARTSRSGSVSREENFAMKYWRVGPGNRKDPVFINIGITFTGPGLFSWRINNTKHGPSEIRLLNILSIFYNAKSLSSRKLHSFEQFVAVNVTEWNNKTPWAYTGRCIQRNL